MDNSNKSSRLKQLTEFVGLLFIIVTGLAALPHTVWSFSTVMNGSEPSQFNLNWFAWIFTGLMLGISIDVGQIVISIQIARGERTLPRYVAFGVLCLLTFYCQWLYTADHTPLIGLGQGINLNVMAFSGGLRDAGVWLLPASIPFATLIYTFGYTSARRSRPNTVRTVREPLPTIEKPEPRMLPEHASKGNKADVLMYLDTHPLNNGEAWSIGKLMEALTQEGINIGRTTVGDALRERKQK